MAKTAEQPQFDDFREAFCAYYRCRSESFERKVFWKTLNRLSILPAVPIYLFNRRFFDKDFDAIRAFGAARTPDEMSQVTTEFATVNRLERSIRRGFMHIRISGTRLLNLYDRLQPYVRQPQLEPQETFVPKGAAIDAVMSGRSDIVRGEGSALVARKLRQAHSDITSGRPVAQVLSAMGYTEGTFLEALEQNGVGNPDLRWLREYLLRERRFTELEGENSRLNRKVASQSMEIDTLKERSEPPRNA